MSEVKKPTNLDNLERNRKDCLLNYLILLTG